MNTDKPVPPSISFALQKYQAQIRSRTQKIIHPSSQPIPKSFSSYEVGGGVVRKVEQ